MREETLDQLNDACRRLTDVASAIRADTDAVVATHDHIEVIKDFYEFRQATQRIKEAREALQQMEDKLSYEQVPEVMREHDVRTITVEGVGRVSLTNRWSCSMLDKYAGMDWLRNNGHDDLIIETVNSSTLGAFARNLSEETNVELPDDLFKDVGYDLYLNNKGDLMEDHFSVCIKKIGDVVTKHVKNPVTANDIMIGVIQVVGDYAITEIKELNLRTNEILTKTLEVKNEQRSN